MKRILPFILLAVAGCASQQPIEIINQSRASLKLLPKEDLLKCMGKPVHEEKTDKRETLIFSGAAPEQPTCPMRAFMGQQSPAKRYCWASVTLKEGRVENIEYPPSNDGVIVTGEQCAFLVENCVKTP
ncbi:hypothetical protein [Methylomagnum sp.]